MVERVARRCALFSAPPRLVIWNPCVGNRACLGAHGVDNPPPAALASPAIVERRLEKAGKPDPVSFLLALEQALIAAHTRRRVYPDALHRVVVDERQHTETVEAPLAPPRDGLVNRQAPILHLDAL